MCVCVLYVDISLLLGLLFLLLLFNPLFLLISLFPVSFKDFFFCFFFFFFSLSLSHFDGVDVSHRMALVEGRQFDSLKELRQAVRDDAIGSHIELTVIK